MENIENTDNGVYYLAVHAFFLNGNPYSVKYFFYTIYFCIIYSFMMLPYLFEMSICIGINVIIAILFLQNLKREEDASLYYWLLISLATVFYNIPTLNVNSLIAVVLYYVWKYRQYWYSYLLLLLILYKLNCLVVVLPLVVIDFWQSPHQPDRGKKLITIIGLLIFAGVMYWLSLPGLAIGVQYQGFNIILYIQPSFIVFYSFLLPLLFAIPSAKIKQLFSVWYYLGIFIFTILYSLFLFFNSEIKILNYL